MSRTRRPEPVLFKKRIKKSFYLVKRYFLEIVIEVDMTGSGNNQKFLVVAGQFLERIFTELTRMGLLPVNP